MMQRTRGVIALCARQELRLALRSRWTQMFAVVFAVLAVAVGASGYVLSGGSGMQDFSRVAASLLQLVLLLVPLTALVAGVTSLTPEAGAAELLFSQPASRRAILMGKLLGLFVALVAAQATGFGAAGLVISARAGTGGLAGFLAVAAASCALTAVALAAAAAISAGDTSRRRARALAVAIVTWFAAVLLFDVAALGLASTLPSGFGSRVLMVAVIANPVDAIRTATLLLIEGSAAFGSSSLAFLRFTGGPAGATLWLAASVTAWIVAPIAAATIRLSRADI